MKREPEAGSMSQRHAVAMGNVLDTFGFSLNILTMLIDHFCPPLLIQRRDKILLLNSLEKIQDLLNAKRDLLLSGQRARMPAPGRILCISAPPGRK